MFLGLITRCKDEYFIAEFCEYYLLEGVEKIYVIDDDSKNKSIYDSIKNNSKIEIIYETNILPKNYAQTLYNKVKDNFIWMIYCDVDEFITTKKNKKNTISDELKTTFADVDCVKIPRVFMSCNNRKKNPKSILLENNYRWNHDLKHENTAKNDLCLKWPKFRCRYNRIECKCIFKTQKYDKIRHHIPIPDDKKKSILVNGIDKKIDDYTQGYNKLREYKIKNGFLLCYHYRIISQENCLNKLSTSKWYIECKYTLDDLMSSDHPEIIDNTLRNKVNNNRLKFVHITKTAGSYIEDIGLKKDLYWGKNDNILKTFWHTPLCFFKENPYNKNIKLFTVVRNPYTRILSECECKYGSSKYNSTIDNTTDLNNYIKERLLKLKEKNYSFKHFLPQYLYTHDNNGNKIIDYIIKYEELYKLNDLFKNYLIDINIEQLENNNKKFTINDISKENIELINDVYHLDFIYYNYNKLTN